MKVLPLFLILCMTVILSCGYNAKPKSNMEQMKSNTECPEILELLKKGQLDKCTLNQKIGLETLQSCFPFHKEATPVLGKMGTNRFSKITSEDLAWAPYGLVFWLDKDEQVFVIQINRPDLSSSDFNIHGDDWMKKPSGLGRSLNQLVQVTKGVAVHKKYNSDELRTIYLFEPTSVENYDLHPVSKVKTERRPKR